MKRRLAQLPLHSGKAPPWLFRRMVSLAGAVTMAIVDQFGPQEVVRRLADPWWFQAFGCVLGFDWHSSGVTTVTCGAMKEAHKKFGRDLGIIVTGGKGGTSRKTPSEIAQSAHDYGIEQGDRLIYASKMSAKVDSAAVQDGFELYHHTMVFTPEGQWCVVQQGMNTQTQWARRYHWLGEHVADFVCEPHAAVQDLAADAPQRDAPVLNMVASEASDNRTASTALVRENPDWLMSEIARLTEGPTLFAPARHPVLPIDVDRRRLRDLIIIAHQRNPQDFESLLGTTGVGAAAIRSLSLLAEIIFHAPASHRDPGRSPRAAAANSSDAATDVDLPAAAQHWADYSYAHGGKDGTPFPVDRVTYDRNIQVLTDAIRGARIGENEKMEALKRLGLRRRT